jgi:hypothetical protein
MAGQLLPGIDYDNTIISNIQQKGAFKILKILWAPSIAQAEWHL